ncbi:MULTISPECIES: TIGR01458 family HAD-type hydrolase [unclassified Methanoculleus]|uniref:TIGR01458 family HAD-type hydrolase n=1 Tax=unclassified Methanoculleus TaxID=2619537 RepID=UPI0025DBC3A3|nr:MULTISPECIES: TIGR01458 family HAD-type hydrolase [unclassified Methanoculleus]MCK9318042.1 TIGR01458 family HAD-type hydrolase [Methanoculleus sp.]MDD2253226.1 TIGR01458 family HAD-type hydrolase [Methanoculleus sp.]MDD2786571.1 TIGR01458 family HAD-type hydrolase [Methanoculleus sp.]MDD3215536.1 TIGR01458 family HAD-type hydrolase [Methanoculleus sp.]MDD4313190.1 TIGR01458 family HAD-type hydrolase [Methanoculleus sp.]
MTAIHAFLIDIDGVLYVGDRPIEGADRALRELDRRGIPYRFVSNTTRRSRASVARRLESLGYTIPEAWVITAPVAAAAHLKEGGRTRCFLLTTSDARTDFEGAGIRAVEENPDAVVVADAAEGFTYENMNRAFRLLLSGADLVALEKDRYWMGSDGLMLSAGPFAAALEYATGREAEVIGKPSPAFFFRALAETGARPEEAAMVGDDIVTDIGGAQACGMRGIQVRTGKYREETLAWSGITPDLVIDSLADLPEYL